MYPRESDMAKWSTLSIVGEIQVKTATPKFTRMTRVVMLSLFNVIRCQSRSIENHYQETVIITLTPRSFREVSSHHQLPLVHNDVCDHHP
jgi:hypothetical protein